ncbi:MAG: histidine kinase [Alistipes sp.]|nr:histidine kinase [Alistipes sp.]
MKRARTEHWISLLVAVAVSLVINFSYLMLLFGDQNNEMRPRIPGRNIEYPGVAELSISPDGYGYLIYVDRDSVYVPQERIRWFRLQHGDRMEVDVNAPRRPGAHYRLNRIYTLNGMEFDYNKFFNYPSQTLESLLQMLFYILLSFMLTTVVQRTVRRRHYSTRGMVMAGVWCLVIAVVMYMIAPYTDWHEGSIKFNFMRNDKIDALLILKCSMATFVSILFAWVRLLVSRQQEVEMQLEQLKNESLTAKYNMLMGQISPHFFFNSLNSLSMLVRDKQTDTSLRYIEQLSYTFRYIIQNGQNTLIPLGEELKFAEAYSYQYSIRYADKLFFDFSIDDRFRTWKLPALSLQPLIGNAVKHNTITKSKPLHVDIRTTTDGWLVISNPIVPKLEREPSTGIGLENLSNRWRLITGCDIEIQNDGQMFVVRMPLQPPTK